MSNNSIQQDSVTTTLNIHPSVFTAALIDAIPQGKVGWTAEEHYELLKKLLTELKDASGRHASITTEHADVLRLIYKPSEEAERQVLRQSFANAGYTLDGATENLFVMMFSAPQFASFLEKTNRPQTDSPFIKKDKSKKRGAKKETFTSLLGSSLAVVSPPPEPTTTEAEVEENIEQPPEGAAATGENVPQASAVKLITTTKPAPKN